MIARFFIDGSVGETDEVEEWIVKFTTGVVGGVGRVDAPLFDGAVAIVTVIRKTSVNM